MTKRKCQGNPNGRPAPKHDISPLRGIQRQQGKAHFRYEDALRIRQFVQDAGKPRGMITQIAQMIGVTPMSIWEIVDGRAYK